MQLTNGIKCFDFIMKLFPLTLNLISTIILLMFIQATVPVTCLLIPFSEASGSINNFNEYHSSGIEPSKSHEIVFPKINHDDDGPIKLKTKVKRNANEMDVDKIVTITSHDSKKVYYLMIKPNQELLHYNLSLTNELFGHNFVRECFFHGVILYPVKGRVAISSCGNDNKMFALMITDNNHIFVLRPLDGVHQNEIVSSKIDRNSTKTNMMMDIKKKIFDTNSEKELTFKFNNNTKSFHVSNEKHDDEMNFHKKIQENEFVSSFNLNKSFVPHVLYNSHQLETELSDLAFINNDDKESIFNQFIVTQQQVKDSLRNNSFWERHQFNNNKTKKVRKRRRAIRTRKTIETAVFIDYDLAEKFNGRKSDLIRLVLSIMNEVQLIYSFKSMKTRIKIVIVKLVMLKKGESSPDKAGGDIDKYLDNFCAWQARKLKRQDEPTKWDHALMLTGVDLYKLVDGKKNNKVLGLAWVNGMCKSSYSCTLNEGKSFEAAFVIAHEMGHSLGILHDGRGNNCDPDKYIMSERTGPGKVNWSPCSNVYLENFLSKANAECLDDHVNPTSRELDFTKTGRLPGEQYPPNIQCQLALGSQYQAYTSPKEPFNNICRELWCLAGSWATPAHPALEGSICGSHGLKCYQGVCSNVTNMVVDVLKSSESNQKTYHISRNPIVTDQIAKDSGQTERNSTPESQRQTSGANQRSHNLSKYFMDKIKDILRSATSSVRGFFSLF